MNAILIIFVLAGLYQVSKIISKIISDRKCVDADTIHKFMHKQLSKQEHHHLISHLGGCQKCQQLMRDYNETN